MAVNQQIARCKTCKPTCIEEQAEELAIFLAFNFTVLLLFLETALDPAASTNPYVEAVRSRIAFIYIGSISKAS